MTTRGDQTRISATVDDVELWFESSAFSTGEGVGNAFLSLTLLAAMAQGRNLDLTALPPVSPQLLDTLPLIQHAWSTWNPLLTPVEVEARRGTPSASQDGTLVASSGGIHSVACALDGAPGQPLLFIAGLDNSRDSGGSPAPTARRIALAAALDVPLVTVETNWESWRKSLKLSWSMMHGSCLMAVAHLLNPGRMMIAATRTYQSLIPHGTHVLIDRHWSTESTAIEHWGCHRTFADKISRLAERPELCAALQLCDVSGEVNCGRCVACARARLAFHLRGVDFPVEATAGTATPLAAYQPYLDAPSESEYLPSLIALAQDGNHSAIVGVLERGRVRNQRARWWGAMGRTLRGIAGSASTTAAELLPWGQGPAPEIS